MRKLLPILLLAALPAQAAVFRVTKTADTLDGVCDDDCSLREAVVAANALPGKDFVLAGPGVYTSVVQGASRMPEPPATSTSTAAWSCSAPARTARSSTAAGSTGCSTCAS